MWSSRRLKPGRDGSAVLRVYEAAGQSASGVKIAMHAKVASARTVNALEEPEGELKVEGDAVTLDLRPLRDQDDPMSLTGG